ncbi:outer membrane protein assembly factor [Polaribacter vadi]|uniref:BamA/TamA family outer membrane protein n=1 Tax=Polaribacter TaxID=52959 RepID=UPI001C0A3B19|nr:MULTISPECIES: BamA/TamA family outer membrane protein [Polaribacter]MBU3011086.1 outer membrane protein assembly factor [Polaribacter vadi]MDO6740900.1 BamA/TamA family outer membrane protein [Polaribacter sp. 1_MG-2023]
MRISQKIGLLICILTLSLPLNAQEKESGLDKFVEYFTFYPNKDKVAKDSTLYLSKIITAPILSYSPETSLGFGVGAKYLFKFKGSGEETRTSNMPVSLLYTLKNQFFVYSGFEIFTNQEKWVISGNIIFQNYPRLYYGIGQNSPETNEENYDNYQFLFEPILLKQAFTRYLFLGGGVRYNKIYKTKIEPNKLLATNQPSGFDGSTSVGFELAALYDSRDNILNASKGWYLELTRGFYGTALGGTHQFELTRFDLRHYLKVSQKNDDVLAFQAIGHFANGDTPLSELALFGNEEIMRGYIEGRYIEENLLAAQVEYRKTFKDSRFGMVAFLGAGDVFNKSKDLSLNDIKLNYGVGLRFMLDKKEKLNIRFDYGMGSETDGNFYVNIAEAY